MRPKRLPNRLEFGLVAFSILILFICLIYTFVLAFRTPVSGLLIDSDGLIRDLPNCWLFPDLCNTDPLPVSIDDLVVSLGDTTYERFGQDRRLVPFDGYLPGELVPLTISRNGNVQTISWLMPNTSRIALVNTLASLLTVLPFWIAGTVILLFMKPKDLDWLLLVLFNYLTALWIAFGINSGSHVAYSSLFLHALSWLLVPIYLHLHLQLPAPIFRKSYSYLLPTIYVASGSLAILELFQQLPGSAYVVAILVAALGSFGILVYRTFSESSAADRLATRLMATGVVLAFGPGILLWVVPIIFGFGSPRPLATIVALLAIPLLPLFYTYAIYKRRLGVLEYKIHRALALYTTFVFFITILTLAFVAGDQLIEGSSELLAFILIVVLAIALAILPLREAFLRRVNLLTYGMEYQQRDIFQLYASKIPAATNRESLFRLLSDEVAPTLRVRRSALFVLADGNRRPAPLDSFRSHETPSTAQNLQNLLKGAGRYRPPMKNNNAAESSEFDWVRLAVPLVARDTTIGVWLFGRRDPDDFYSQEDIELLSTLANQVAISIENLRLIEAVQWELVERQRTESALQSYADRLSLLHEIDQAILAANSPTEIAQVALDSVQRLLPCMWAGVALYDLDSGEAEWLAVQSVDESKIGLETRFPLEELGFIDGFRSSELRIVKDIQDVSRLSPFFRILVEEGAASFVSAPLAAFDNPTGSLNLAAESQDAFNGDHVEIVREVANSVAVALQSTQLVSAVRRHRRDLQQLSARLLSAQETERKRISYELHDEIGQVLTAITYNLAALQQELSEDASADMRERLADTKILAEQVMKQVRALSLELRPSMLHDLGLIPTLRWYINRYAKRLDLEVDFEVRDIDSRLPEELEIALYRVVQEAFTNVVRHAEANRVRLCLDRNGSKVRALIEDDGRGFYTDNAFSYDTAAAGTGLIGIRERVFTLGGDVFIRSVPGQGTRLSVEIPVLEVT